MIYQIKEKAIYSESYLLHFGEVEIFGDVINALSPDYTGISIGSVIYQNENKNIIHDLKTKLEISRIKAINEMLVAFFDDETLAKKFYSSSEFSRLQDLYRKDFNLNLIRKDHGVMEVEGKGFYIPSEVSDDQVIEIQKILNIYFFRVEEISVEEKNINNDIDWDSRLAILYPNKEGKIETGANLKNDSNEKLKDEPKVLAEKKKIEHIENKISPKKWWKLW